MKSYETIRDISNGLYLGIKSEKEVEDRLKDVVQKVHSQISDDFKLLFGRGLNLLNFHVYVNDETYRQSATGLILNETLRDNENFQIRVECLIDQGRIWIKVKKGKEISDFIEITRRIEQVQNSEGLTELKEINNPRLA